MCHAMRSVYYHKNRYALRTGVKLTHKENVILRKIVLYLQDKACLSRKMRTTVFDEMSRL